MTRLAGFLPDLSPFIICTVVSVLSEPDAVTRLAGVAEFVSRHNLNLFGKFSEVPLCRNDLVSRMDARWTRSSMSSCRCRTGLQLQGLQIVAYDNVLASRFDD